MKRNFGLLTMVAIALFISVVACTKENEQSLSGSSTGCDTVNMHYAADVVPILQQHCYSCHGNGSTGGSGGILLDGYSNLKIYADNGKLLGNIRHLPGFVGMPYMQPMLDSCTINKIASWVNNGKQDN